MTLPCARGTPCYYSTPRLTHVTTAPESFELVPEGSGVEPNTPS